MKMKLEFLANELLLDLFGYMSFGHILHSFQSLNSRFNQLIFVYLRTSRHLDLRFLSMRDFNIVCQSELSQIVNQIFSIIFENDNDAPFQIEFFHCDDFSLCRFTNLQSLSLYHIHSEHIMKGLALSWSCLRHLTHINLIDCCFSSDDKFTNSMINMIWDMPKLVHCYLSSTSCNRYKSHWPSIVSSSLKYVSIQNFSNDKCSLSNLFQCTPNLRCLHVYSKFEERYAVISSFLPSLVKFELNEECSGEFYNSIGTNGLHNLLKKMPNLCYLSIESLFIFKDGCQWENLINNYFPKLKTFRCKMRMYFDNADETDRRVHNLLRSFQSQFWLENHRCYIRCHWFAKNNKNYILYYTLPYTFTYSIAMSDYLWFKSTCPYQGDYWPTDSVHKLIYNFDSPIKVNTLLGFSSLQELNRNRPIFPQRSISFRERISQIFQFNSNETELDIVKNDLIKKSLTPFLSNTCLIPQFTNIRELSVELPFDKYFWYFIPKLDQLFSLNILLSNDYADRFHLQDLLNQAPNLYSLSIICFKISTPKFFLANIRNASIRKLNLIKATHFHQRFFYNIQQCVQLSRSPLGKQCEILTIKVDNKECIVYLVKEMINLQSLNVQCYDSSMDNLPTQKKCDDVVSWLKVFLPSTIKIERYRCCDDTIHLLIR